MFIRVVGLIFIILCLPVFVLIGALIVVFDGFPFLFVQQRIGRFGLPFFIYKFRTMRNGAEKEKRRLLRKNESDGPVFKIHNDPRFTGIGKFLSHTGLDELPQLYNIFRGEMAFIGPRPLPVSEEKKLQPWMRARHAILPGLISPAILTGKYHQNFARWMKSDVTYAKRKSVKKDARLAYRFAVFILRLLWKELSG